MDNYPLTAASFTDAPTLHDVVAGLLDEVLDKLNLDVVPVMLRPFVGPFIENAKAEALKDPEATAKLLREVAERLLEADIGWE